LLPVFLSYRKPRHILLHKDSPEKYNITADQYFIRKYKDTNKQNTSVSYISDYTPPPIFLYKTKKAIRETTQLQYTQQDNRHKINNPVSTDQVNREKRITRR